MIGLTIVKRFRNEKKLKPAVLSMPCPSCLSIVLGVCACERKLLWSLRKLVKPAFVCDNVSECCCDLIQFFLLFIQEPSTKRIKQLPRVTSLASLIPPVKTTPLKRIGQTLQVCLKNIPLTKIFQSPFFAICLAYMKPTQINCFPKHVALACWWVVDWCESMCFFF